VAKRIAKYKTTFAHKMQRHHDHSLPAKPWRKTSCEPESGSSTDALTSVKATFCRNPHKHAVYGERDSPVHSCTSRTNTAVGPSRQRSNKCHHLSSIADQSKPGPWSLEGLALPDLTDVEKVGR
jgi:hypothetical protein